MKKYALVFAMLLTPLLSFATVKLYADQKIDVKENTDSVLLTSKTIGGGPMMDGYCVLKLSPAGFPRQISQGASFYLMSPVKVSGLTQMTADEFRNQVKQWLGIDLDPQGGMSLQELVAELKNKYAIVYDAPGFYSQTLDIASYTSGSTYQIVCKTASEQTAESILANLYKYATLKPSQEL